MGWWKNMWHRHVVAPLPDEMTRCGSCNKSECSDEHFRTCPNRLKAAGAGENPDQVSAR